MIDLIAVTLSAMLIFNTRKLLLFDVEMQPEAAVEERRTQWAKTAVRAVVTLVWSKVKSRRGSTAGTVRPLL